MPDAPPENLDELTYEQAIARLEQIVQRIESGETGLEDALKQYEAGSALIKRCRGILDSAEQRIARLTADEQGGLSVEGEADEDQHAPDPEGGTSGDASGGTSGGGGEDVPF